MSNHLAGASAGASAAEGPAVSSLAVGLIAAGAVFAVLAVVGAVVVRRRRQAAAAGTAASASA
jgi:hypothetical protein